MSVPSNRIVVIATVPTSSVEKRDELIKQLLGAADAAQNNEPGTLKYAVCVPRDPAKETDIWMIEEYADKAALDQHMSLPTITAMAAWIGANPGPSPPTIRTLAYPSDTFQFSRAAVADQKDPWIIAAELNYHPDGAATSIPYWQAVVDEGREKEDGTLVYGVLKDVSNAERLWTIEAYESETYLKDVHVKSNAIAESIKNTKHLRTGLEWVFLTIKGGFLHK
ncbi:hypothetical protein SODALDRAFT_344835 [Sodiomyces alkalinus F11]|uniref:ABM domain-containing protein n=1 Tax=Sodiomyces alkalinus (strain CBS 110278 / VKM F-3762 / F11) TaxID=1314773 RepID=A0A3N2PU57_SODAK|nr:hypothetical protein SODALDRAFT_344835 [Sodiomyces alkalinus F11]ROT38012.1 hypothetical protein SODALDRAFT_344835 [Sodiomyces alkalinus F11]